MRAKGSNFRNFEPDDKDFLILEHLERDAGLTTKKLAIAVSMPQTTVHNRIRKLKEAGVRTGFGDPWLRIGPVKFMSDGSCSGRSMAMSTPYTGRPNDYGVLVMSQEEVHEAVEEAHRAGWQVAIHANGDVTIDLVLKAYERAHQLWPRA